jgi:hypothetical protein
MSFGRRELVVLFALLLALSSVAALNYERNVRAENAERPYHVYGDRDLDRLIAAYREEVERSKSKHRSAREGAAGPGRGQAFDERVRDFERAQRAGTRQRDALGDLAEREAMLRDLENEKRARRGGGDLALFLRRLVAL